MEKINKSLISVVLKNGFYYKGKLISEDSDFLNIIDKFGNEVNIRKADISAMQKGVKIE